jgi:predicted RNA-binding Zn-ribbon protein involved in translation (DUF1610 family)
MTRGTFFQCEHCKQKAYNEFPLEWMHVASLTLQVGRGCYLEKNRTSGYEDEYANENRYQVYKHLTFCSILIGSKTHIQNIRIQVRELRGNSFLSKYKAMTVYLHCPNCGNILESEFMKTAKTFYIICRECGHKGYSWFSNPSRRDNGL